MTRMTWLAAALTAAALASVSHGDTGLGEPADRNILLDDPEEARDTAAIAFERITGDPAPGPGDPDLNRVLREQELPPDVTTLSADPP